jgi:hypothetical protein
MTNLTIAIKLIYTSESIYASVKMDNSELRSLREQIGNRNWLLNLNWGGEKRLRMGNWLMTGN